MKRIVFLMTSCKRSGPVQQMLNLTRNFDVDQVDVHLVTLYDEEREQSMISEFKPFVVHHFVPTSKLEMVSGMDFKLRRELDQIQPDMIHSVGVFPHFAVSRMKKWRHLVTLHNYVYDDYPAKYGKLRGEILARLDLYAIRHADEVVACSESLAGLYRERLGMNYGFIRNGVDTLAYGMPSAEEKWAIREELGLPQDAFVYVYSGQMIERKNVGFLLETYASCCQGDGSYLLLLGDGPLLPAYADRYGKMANIDFRGNVRQVDHYLKACDAYISASFSEGMPMGVLEAMATGLPFVLSDIVPHQEIYKADSSAGMLFKNGNREELCQKMREVRQRADEMGAAAYDSVEAHFNARLMSRKYQEIYNGKDRKDL